MSLGPLQPFLPCFSTALPHLAAGDPIGFVILDRDGMLPAAPLNHSWRMPWAQLKASKRRNCFSVSSDLWHLIFSTDIPPLAWGAARKLPHIARSAGREEERPTCRRIPPPTCDAYISMGMRAEGNRICHSRTSHTFHHAKKCHHTPGIPGRNVLRMGRAALLRTWRALPVAWLMNRPRTRRARTRSIVFLQGYLNCMRTVALRAVGGGGRGDG